ncbi:VRR-NUC domain-containing protein [Pseudomonas sp. M47T1]|uniref:VRR-NUC domain-containing protein n=3 Tax=unclassified Pseudomonas TaxID=196821 RepID=UPI0005B8E729|nr:VRR-NUC domain-containing protein [Pseudomonas sp. M47T1]
MTPGNLDDPFYYLINFQRVLEWLARRYADLLDSEERRFIDGFAGLPRAPQALLVRMVMRKGPLYRASKLVYGEIGCTHAAVAPLVQAGWVDNRAPLSVAQLFEVLQKAEVVTLFKAQLSRTSLRKEQLLAELLEQAPAPQPFTAWCPDMDDAVYSLPVRPLCDRLRLLFFGNLRQDWSEFVLADLGIYRYEQVELDPASRGLQSRADIDFCVQLHACRQALEEGGLLAPLLQQLATLHSDNAWLQGRRDRLLFAVGQQCERQDLLEQALAIYEQCAYPGARARRIRVLERCEHYEAALALAEVALAASESAAEAQQIPRMVPRLRRKLGLPALPRVGKAAVNESQLLLAQDPGLSVEQRVARHLHLDEAPVHYVENSLINSLFGLLCWPAIFAALPGAFFHPFQSGPTDLHQPDFRQRRGALFDACLAQLHDGRYQDSIRACYRDKWGLQSPFVYWQALTQELLELALHCLPAEHLHHCFERLLQDIAANRAGMPDLIQFWPAERRYQMIEVKGPGDRLQDNQLRWLEFCARHALPVQVCYVQWAQA